MNHKRKTHKKVVGRKAYDASNSMKSWSSKIHHWWKKDVYDKLRFKKQYEP